MRNTETQPQGENSHLSSLVVAHGERETLNEDCSVFASLLRIGEFKTHSSETCTSHICYSSTHLSLMSGPHRSQHLFSKQSTRSRRTCISVLSSQHSFLPTATELTQLSPLASANEKLDIAEMTSADATRKYSSKQSDFLEFTLEKQNSDVDELRLGIRARCKTYCHVLVPPVDTSKESPPAGFCTLTKLGVFAMRARPHPESKKHQTDSDTQTATVMCHWCDTARCNPCLQQLQNRSLLQKNDPCSISMEIDVLSYLMGAEWTDLIRTKQPIRIHCVDSGDVPQSRATSFLDHLDHCGFCRAEKKLVKCELSAAFAGRKSTTEVLAAQTCSEIAKCCSGFLAAGDFAKVFPRAFSKVAALVIKHTSNEKGQTCRGHQWKNFNRSKSQIFCHMLDPAK